jgi:NAD+ diphosphatase
MDIREAYKYCPRCAREFDRSGPVNTCPACGLQWFNPPAPGANILLVDGEGRILLGRRGREPSIGKWELPGGFIEAGESLEDGAVREAKEELGLDIDPAALHYAASQPDMYLYDNIYEPVVSPTFWAAMPEGVTPEAKDDVSEVQFFAPEKIPYDKLSSPPHEKAIKAFLAMRSA